MATIKIRFRMSSVKDNCGTLYYQIIHRRMVRQIYTDSNLGRDEWDADAGGVLICSGCGRTWAEYLHSVRERLRRGMAGLKEIVTRLNGTGRDYTVDDGHWRFPLHVR